MSCLVDTTDPPAHGGVFMLVGDKFGTGDVINIGKAARRGERQATPRRCDRIYSPEEMSSDVLFKLSTLVLIEIGRVAI